MRNPPMTPQDRQILAQEIQKRVDELTFSELAVMSTKAKNEELKKIKKQVNDYLIRYTIMEKKIEVASKGLNLDNVKNKNLQMYILYKTEKRAETTDTLLFYSCKDRAPLEEIILSIFQEMYQKEIEWAEREDYTNYDTLYEYCISRMNDYGITWVPELED